MTQHGKQAVLMLKAMWQYLADGVECDGGRQQCSVVRVCRDHRNYRKWPYITYFTRNRSYLRRYLACCFFSPLLTQVVTASNPLLEIDRSSLYTVGLYKCMLLVMALQKARGDHCGASTPESFSALFQSLPQA